MDRLLIDTLLFLLYRLLTDSRLGEDIIGHGLDTGLLQGMLVVGMRGVMKGYVDQVEAQVVDIFGGCGRCV